MGAMLYMEGAKSHDVLKLVKQIERSNVFENANKIIIITDVKMLTTGPAMTSKSYYTGKGTYIGNVNY